MYTVFNYFCKAALFLCGLLFSQFVFEIAPVGNWRLLFSNGGTNFDISESFESSIWCHNHSTNHRQCSFRNICFSSLHKQFIFVLSSNSTVWGVEDKNSLNFLDLSSISGHNKFMLKIAIVSSNHVILKRKVVSKEPVYLMWRFKVDNIMHVVHDDLLPLFTSYAKVCTGNVKQCTAKYRLAFVDEEVRGPFHEWYRVLSNNEPLMLPSVNNDSVLCFEDAQMGLLQSSVWFQYGFGMSQGPKNNSGITNNLIKQFTRFMLENLDVKPYHHQKFTSAVLFKREINRKIVNHEFVIKCMQKSFRLIFPDLPKLKVFVLDLSLNSSKTVISIISQSKLVVGMHGAEMILSIFLPSGSLAVELFPYGIVPSHVSPLKSISNITSSLIYKSWENFNENNSHPQPDAPALQGGISHLSLEEQARIKAVLPVPAVQCCHNAAYLYRMFQDTTVGDSFMPLLEQALTSLRSWPTQADDDEILMRSRWWFPGPVSNVSCDVIASTVAINWTPPLNVDDLNVQYAVTISAAGNVMEYATTKSRLEISLGNVSSLLNIWIKCVALDFELESVDTHTACTF